MSISTSAPAGQAIQPGTWNVDPSHSAVEFQVKHMGLATVKGFFSDFEGALTVDEDGNVTAEGKVRAESISTRNDQRDQHLRSADFFETDSHPELTFKSSSIEALDESAYRITGELTMRGVTNEVVFEGTVTGSDVDPWGNTRVGLEVAGEVERSAWGLNWNQALESGGVLVGKKVKIHLDLSAVRA